jgi:hypothetical protein
MINEVGFDLKHEKVQLYGSTSLTTEAGRNSP